MMLYKSLNNNFSFTRLNHFTLKTYLHFSYLHTLTGHLEQTHTILHLLTSSNALFRPHFPNYSIPLPNHHYSLPKFYLLSMIIFLIRLMKLFGNLDANLP